MAIGEHETPSDKLVLKQIFNKIELITFKSNHGQVSKSKAF